jgi:predicted Fe-Mo cluster-binding NifX family protein
MGNMMSAQGDILRIAIPSADDRGLESEVSQHFGRSSFYTFVDVEDSEIKNVEVIALNTEGHGPGDLPNFVKEHGGEMVVAYGMGGRAVDFFNQLGIQVVTGAYGKIADVVQALLSSDLMVDENWKAHGDFGKHEHE